MQSLLLLINMFFLKQREQRIQPYQDQTVDSAPSWRKRLSHFKEEQTELTGHSHVFYSCCLGCLPLSCIYSRD